MRGFWRLRYILREGVSASWVGIFGYLKSTKLCNSIPRSEDGSRKRESFRKPSTLLRLPLSTSLVFNPYVGNSEKHAVLDFQR